MAFQDTTGRRVAAPSGRDRLRTSAPPLCLFVAALAAAVAIIFFSGAMMALAATPDYPWLLQAGRRILGEGGLPDRDIFSWTSPDRPWLLYQWSFEAIVAALDAALGPVGVLLAFIWAALALYVLVPLRWLGPRVPVALAVIVAALGLTVVTVNLSLRPMIVTTAGLLLQHALVARLRRSEISIPAAAIAAGALYATWANMHTGFALGLAALALTILGDFLERRGIGAGDGKDRSAPLPPIPLLALLAAALVGSLVNPYGWGVHAHLLKLSGSAYFNAHIGELGSADFHHLQFKLFLLFPVVLAAALMRARHAVRPADLLQLAVLTFATLVANRFVVWAVILYVLILPRAMIAAWPGIGMLLPRASDRSFALLFVFLAAVVPPLLAARGLVNPEGRDCSRFDRGIRAYAAAQRPSDRLLTDPLTGSCAIGAAPGVRVFIDTRFDYYGAAFTRSLLDALALRPGWSSLLDRWNIDTAVLDRHWPLAELLRIDPGWRVLYEDAQTVVVRRMGPVVGLARLTISSPVSGGNGITGTSEGEYGP
jgi:hypothetical protein